MKAVIIAVDPVMDIDPIHMNTLALDGTDTVIRAVQQVDIANHQALTPIKKHVIWPFVSADPTRWRSTANR